MPDKDIDRREDLLNLEHHRYCVENRLTSIMTPNFPEAYKDAAKMAMDEYFTVRALELLDFMLKNCVAVCIGDDNQKMFLYKTEALTKEQLFENFL